MTTVTTETTEPLHTEDHLPPDPAPLTDEDVLGALLDRNLTPVVIYSATTDELLNELARRKAPAFDLTRQLPDLELLTEALARAAYAELEPLRRPCSYCKSPAGAYCRTSSGAIVAGTHTTRRTP